jgi:hypothetical protein
MKQILSSSLLLVVTIALSSQYVIAQAGPDDIVKRFFTEYSKDGAEKALNNLYSTNSWISKAGSSTQTLKLKMEEQLSKDEMGEYNGYELIARKELGGSYVIASYMAKFERQPIRFTFQFYKPKDKWGIYSFEYDGNVGAEMEESIKLVYLTLDSDQK